MLNKITIIFTIYKNYYPALKIILKALTRKKQPQKQVKHFKKTS